MFSSIPNADALLLKNDKACVKILINCQNVVPEKTGKLIIVGVVLQPNGNEMFVDIGLAFDLHMMVSLVIKSSKFHLYSPLSRLIQSDIKLLYIQFS
ncbi:hypothetical protein ACOSQ3_002438 [Xanthoceras sorbifolium]